MKFRRFLALFLLLALLASQCLCLAYAEGEEDFEQIHIDAGEALLMDADSGAILYQQNAHEQVSIASVTKVMTCLVVLEAIERGELELEKSVTAAASAVNGLPADGSNADPAIVEGEIMTVHDLLYCMMVVSANEACNVLAEAVSGTVAAFVERMNTRAQELGCKDTHFVNTNGLTAAGHYSCAWDVYLIAREAMKNETFLDLCSATWKNIAPTNKCEKQRQLHTTNSLLDGWRYSGYQYGPAKGIKTGSTEAAGHCLVSYAVKGSRTLISVVLGAGIAPDGKGGTNIMSFTETVRLFKWGFENFSTKTILEEEELIAEVPVALSKETNYVTVHPAYSVQSMLPNYLAPEELQRDVALDAETADAPITAGQELGTITLSHGDIVYATVPLLALNDVSVSKFLVAKRAVEEFFAPAIVKILTVLAIVFIVAAVQLVRSYLRRRRYGRNDRRGGRKAYRGRRF